MRQLFRYVLHFLVETKIAEKTIVGKKAGNRVSIISGWKSGSLGINRHEPGENKPNVGERVINI
jgi:hypothetical protein